MIIIQIMVIILIMIITDLNCRQLSLRLLCCQESLSSLLLVGLFRPFRSGFFLAD